MEEELPRPHRRRQGHQAPQVCLLLLSVLSLSRSLLAREPSVGWPLLRRSAACVSSISIQTSRIGELPSPKKRRQQQAAAPPNTEPLCLTLLFPPALWLDYALSLLRWAPMTHVIQSYLRGCGTSLCRPTTQPTPRMRTPPRGLLRGLTTFVSE